MSLNVLSPWAEQSNPSSSGLSPRLDTIDGKTIGMFSHFKLHAPLMLKVLAEILQEKYPSAKFVHLQYPKDSTEIVNDPEFEPIFKKWLSGVDGVISAFGDAGSCAMFQAYNTAYVEKLGIPCVMLTMPGLLTASSRGAASRNVPNMRFAFCEILGQYDFPDYTKEIIDRNLRPGVTLAADNVATALTAPLSPEEENPPQPDQSYSNCVISGSFSDINKEFYMHGWTNGAPIIPPTQEAVNEMLRGTDLPRDHIVAVLPPMLGKATVEKIAVNAVMAGCLPTYLPVLLSAVKGLVDPRIHLEGWICSVSTWGPFISLSGSIVKDLNMNAASGFLSPYTKPAATIARALAFIIMNICGVRPKLEDMSELGHENRMGSCIGENEDENPWEPLHTDFGIPASDSAVTLFWPTEHRTLGGPTPSGLLSAMTRLGVDGWDPGAMFVLTPNAARMMADAGWTRKRIYNYVVEYARHPAAEVSLNWLTGNNHVPLNTELPANPAHMTRVFWSADHMLLIVGGGTYGGSAAAFTGGGDHGGPSVTKIELPKKWDELVKEYSSYIPTYINY